MVNNIQNSDTAIVIQNLTGKKLKWKLNNNFIMYLSKSNPTKKQKRFLVQDYHKIYETYTYLYSKMKSLVFIRFKLDEKNL